MSRLPVALATIVGLGLTLASQSFAAQVVASEAIAEALSFAIPSLHLKGVVRPASGHRLQVVTIALGDSPIDADVRRFVLVTSGGDYEPIGAGGSAALMIPLDQVPADREVGEILPSNAIVALTRRSSTSVTLEAGPGATLAFLFELPLETIVRALRLPDGRELVTAR